MDRNREARRVAMPTPNGLPRQRHRTGSLRDSSPEHEGALKIQETARFRERTGRKERDRENERSERDRLSRSKRWRGEKYTHGKDVDDSSDESEEEDEDTYDAPVRHMPPNPVSVPSSASPSSALTSQRKSYPPTWKASDEMIGVSIPRKARSASTKRPYDSWSSAAGVAGEQFLRTASSSSPVASSAVLSPSPAPVSPTSSSLSIKKKVNGSKQRPPKSTKSPSSIQEDIEIEVAEVLYGLMRQSQGPSKEESMPNGSSEPVFVASVPKRKKPRLVIQPEENTPVPTIPKIEADLPAKPEIRPPKLDNNSDPPAENGGVSIDLVKPHGLPVPKETATEKRFAAAEQLQAKESVKLEKVKEVASSEKKSVQQITTATGDKESCREEKFEIDLMAPPPQSRSSPEGGGDMDYYHEPMAVDGEAELCLKPSVGEKAVLNTEVPGETQKPKLNSKAKDTNLHFTSSEKSVAPSGAYDDKLTHQVRIQPPLLSLNPSRNDTSTDKTAQPSHMFSSAMLGLILFFIAFLILICVLLDSFVIFIAQPSSLPPLSTVPAGWPPGHTPIGYMAPLQGAAVSLDGRTMTPAAIQPPHFLFNQPRPGRCATHGYIAKSIHSHHQSMKNYPIWPPAAGGAPLFNANPCNLNVVPATADLHGTSSVRGDVSLDKGQAFAFFPGQQPLAVKDKSAQLATNMIVEDGGQKKQFFQSLPHGGPSNMMHSPATFFFPMSQQQVAAAGAAVSSRANSTKPMVAAGAASASTATSALHATATAGQASPATLSFSYPNMAGSEAGYMAILGNGAYHQFPIPAHVGAAQAYRGAPPQVMPFFNGSYYPSPIPHPSQLQMQQQQQAPPPPQQIHQSHQKPSNSTVSSSSQKQPQNHSQRSQGSSANGLTTNSPLQTFPAPKSRTSETQQHEMGREGSPSTANSCFSRPPNMSLYGQNFAMPFNPANFTLMSPPVSVSGATNGIHPENSPAPQGFALSFNSVSGAMAAGLDSSSKAHNHVMLQSLPEAARNNYHMMSAAAAAQASSQQKMNYHGSEDRKSGAPNSSIENERKGSAARASASAVQSISFSRPDSVETSAATVSGNNVVDTSARSSNLAPGSVHSSRSSALNTVTNNNSAATNSQLQQLHQQQRQFLHHCKQQELAARNKAPVTSNGSVYPDHLSSTSSTAAKFPNALSSPVAQSSYTSAQSQWKNSGRTTTASQVSSPSMSTSTTTSMNNLGQQQQGRPQQGQTQISFGGNQKVSTASQVQQGPNVAQTPSPSMIGSPSASSVSRGHSGSPRMSTSTHVGSKPTQSSSMSTQQGRNSPSMPSQKSSPVAGSGRILPPVFGNMPASSNMGSSKPQFQQQQQQQQQLQHQLLQQAQLSKQSIQQTQMFFNAASYYQAHSTNSAAGGFQMQRQQQQQQQQQRPEQHTSKSQGGGQTPSLANASTNDPVKAISSASAVANNVKGGTTQSQSMLHSANPATGGAPMLVSSGFSYVDAVPAGTVQVKPVEQMQVLPKK